MKIQYMEYKDFVHRWECGFFKNASKNDFIEIVNELIAEHNEIVKKMNLEYEHVILSI